MFESSRVATDRAFGVGGQLMLFSVYHLKILTRPHQISTKAQ